MWGGLKDSLTHTHTLSLSLTLTHTHTLSLTHAHSLPHTHTHYLSLTHTLSISLSLIHTLTLSLSHTHTLSLSHTHTHSLSLSLSLSLSHTHSLRAARRGRRRVDSHLILFLSHPLPDRREEFTVNGLNTPTPRASLSRATVDDRRRAAETDATPLKQRDAICRAPLPAPAAEKAVPKLEPNFRKRPDPRWSGRPDDAIQARAFGRESKRSFPAILLLSASCSKPPAARNTELSMEPWTQTPALQGRCVSRLYKDLRCFRSKCSIWCLHGCLCLMETLPPRIRAYRVVTNPPELYFIQSAL